MEKQIKPKVNEGKNNSSEVEVTIHHTEGGPSLESCMISILSSHMSKNANF